MQEAALRAISSRRRRDILRLIWDSERPSREIASHFDVSWQAVSQSLRTLEEAGLVRVRPSGTTRYYRADRAGLGSLQAALLEMWEADVDRLAEAVRRETKDR